MSDPGAYLGIVRFDIGEEDRLDSFHFGRFPLEQHLPSFLSLSLTRTS